MKNVFGESESESEDEPPVKLRKISQIQTRPVIDSSRDDTDNDNALPRISLNDGASEVELEKTFQDILEADGSNENSCADQASPVLKSSVTQSILNPDSIAFKMMQRMGYKMGDHLGTEKNLNAIYEPIMPRLSLQRSGLGATPVKTVPQRADLNVVMSNDSVSEFRRHALRKHQKEAIKKTLRKLQNFCFQASGEETMFVDRQLTLCEVNPKWRLLVSELINSGAIDSNTNPECSVTDSDKHAGAPIPQQVKDTELQLLDLLGFARQTFFYCPYCNVQYEDALDVEQSCPGMTWETHN